jgi:hypothetical protein
VICDEIDFRARDAHGKLECSGTAVKLPGAAIIAAVAKTQKSYHLGAVVELSPSPHLR